MSGPQNFGALPAVLFETKRKLFGFVRVAFVPVFPLAHKFGVGSVEFFLDDAHHAASLLHRHTIFPIELLLQLLDSPKSTLISLSRLIKFSPIRAWLSIMAILRLTFKS